MLLFFRIVGGQVGRNAVPCLAVIAGPKQELRADVDCSLLIRGKRNRRIPVPPEFLIIIWSRLDVASRMRVAIDPANLAALIFGIDVIRVSRVLEHPESIAVVHVFPTMIGDAAWIF